jgi:hypothetical protein
MFEGFVARMVDRAVPTYFRDPAEEDLTREVAEYAIRQTARVAGIAGVTLFVVIAVILFMYFPRQWIGQGAREATRAAPQPGAEHDANLRQLNEDLQKKLDGVTKERDTLQGKLTVLEGQVAKLTSKLQAANALAAPKDAPRPTKQATGPVRTPVLASPSSAYRCGDGRTVRNPAECKPAAPGR